MTDLEQAIAYILWRRHGWEDYEYYSPDNYEKTVREIMELISKKYCDVCDE